MFTSHQRREVAGILLMLVSIVFFLSLISFSVNDIKLLSSAKSVNNIIGPLGAYLGEFFRSNFGYVSFFAVIIFALSGWEMFKDGIRSELIGRIFSLLFLMITASTLISLIYGTKMPYYSGGYTGLFFSRLFRNLFNDVGAFIVTLMLNIIGLVLLGMISVSSIIKRLSGNNIRIGLLLKKILKKVLFFENTKTIPLNNLDTIIERRGKKLPWIIKRRIIIGNDNINTGEISKDKEKIKLLEHKVPLKEQDQFYTDDAEEFASYETAWEDHGLSSQVSVAETYEADEEDNAFPEDYVKAGIPSADVTPEHHTEDDISVNIMEECSAGSFPEEEENAISFVNYTDDESSQILTNRIKSVVLEHDIQPAMILEESDFDNEYDTEEEMADVAVSDTAEAAVKGGDAGNYDSEKVTSYIPRVFDRIALKEKYSVPVEFLETSTPIDVQSWKIEAKRNSELLVKTLSDFGIEARVINVHRGPVITLYEIQIAPGIKVNRVVGLSDDIAMALAAFKVRIVAPIPGKSAIGIEIPNSSREMVTMGDIVNSSEYSNQSFKLKVGLGKDILGNPVTFDLKVQPHLLIAGATGAGKSICLNSIICDLIYNYDPNHVRFILVDPKMVELQLYNGLPHLLTPVITESYLAPKVLKWTVHEMERRYKLLSEVNARDIDKYNIKIKGFEDRYEKLPYIVVVIDELADLMMIAAKEIEGFITRIAQKARAVGIHLLLATQRPSVDIITGVIKANFPARIAFQVPQKIDSRTILDQNGAESLLGRGDMLYLSPVSSYPVRVQGALITEEEILKIVRHTRKYGKPKYIEIEDSFEDEDNDESDDSEDELFVEAIKIIEETKKASASYLQRRLSIGYNRAARIIELMEDRGYVGPQQGSKPREVFI